MKTVLGTFLLFLLTVSAQAEMTYSGKVKDASNNPLNGSYTVIATVRNAANTCVLYTETFSATNFDGTNGGAFSIAFGSGTVGGTAPSIEKVLDTNFTPNPTTGTTYQSCTAGAKRFMYIQVGASAIYGPIPLTSSPSSLAADRAKQVGDLAPANILQLQNGITQTPLTSTQYTNFINMISSIGSLSTNQVMSWNGSSFSGITPLTTESDPSVQAFAKASPPTCSGGQFVTSNGSTLSCATPTAGLTVATASNDGYLASTDYTSFSNKMNKTLSSGNIWVGNGSNVATSVSVSGDVAISNSGVTSIGASKVTSGMIVDGTITGADLNSSINITTSGDVTVHNLTATNYVTTNQVSVGSLTLFNGSGKTLTLSLPGAAANNFALAFPSADGSSGQFLKTDGSGNLSWANAAAGGVTSVSASAPLSSSGGTTPNISITMATASGDGYLSATDWGTFNNKLGTALANGKILVGNGSGVATAVAPGGDVTMDNAGQFTISTAARSVSSLSAAAGSNTIDNGNYSQNWSWNSLTTQTGLALSSTSMATGSVLGVSANSSSGTGPVAYISNNSSTSSSIPLRIVNQGVGSSFRVDDQASDTTPFVIDNSGNVGIGTSAPTQALTVVGTVESTSGGFKFPDGTTMSSTNSITGSSAVAISAGGSNQNITLAATGTGKVMTASPFAISNSTAATSPTSGALTVVGGVGVSGDVYANRVIAVPYWSSDPAFTSSADLTSGMFFPNSGEVALSTNGIDQLHIDSSGRVGINTSGPQAVLDVAGDIVGRAYNNSSGTAIDFSTGNIQYTSASCSSFTLINLKSGGSYTLIVNGLSGGTCSFSASGYTLHLPPDHGPATTSTRTVYNFIVANTDIFISWIPDYQ